MVFSVLVLVVVFALMGGNPQQLLRLLQQARDEAHRFAVTYNRKRRTMRTVTSELLRVPGIGPVKRRLLLQVFGSVQGVRDAGEEAISRLPGFNAAKAKALLEELARTAPVPVEAVSVDTSGGTT